VPDGSGRVGDAFSRQKDRIMIALTRLNGQQFVLNAEKIRYIEATPDTVVCCDTGEKMMVKESLAEVMRKAIEYSRIIRKSITE
jgi:flagellar protein FlbD